MGWQVIVVLAVVIPIVLLPAAFVWYLNLRGLHALLKEAKEKGTAKEKVAIAATRPVKT